MKWYFGVCCSDCVGEDPQGCFDGGCVRYGPYETEKEATAEMEKHRQEHNCSLWEYEVYECETRDIGGRV